MTEGFNPKGCKYYAVAAVGRIYFVCDHQKSLEAVSKLRKGVGGDEESALARHIPSGARILKTEVNRLNMSSIPTALVLCMAGEPESGDKSEKPRGCNEYKSRL